MAGTLFLLPVLGMHVLRGCTWLGAGHPHDSWLASTTIAATNLACSRHAACPPLLQQPAHMRCTHRALRGLPLDHRPASGSGAGDSASDRAAGHHRRTSSSSVTAGRSLHLLLATLQAAAERGAERLRRLERILGSLSPDVRSGKRGEVDACRLGLVSLGEQLRALQLGGAELGVRAALAAEEPGSVGDVKRQLEAQQGALTAWERQVAALMDAIAGLQDPAARKSLSASLRR